MVKKKERHTRAATLPGKSGSDPTKYPNQTLLHTAKALSTRKGQVLWLGLPLTVARQLVVFTRFP